MKAAVNFFIVLLAIAGHAWSQDSIPLYQSGQFPSGPIYTDQTVSELLDKPIPNPSYLIGKFIYLDNRQDEYFFASFASGLTDPTSISFGQVVIGVKFFNNAPELAIGKAIVPNANDPLTIKAVKRSQDGKYILAATESWSKKVKRK